MKKCSICETNIREDNKYQFLTKGIEEFTRYRICNKCFKENFQDIIPELVEFNWIDIVNKKAPCMKCNKSIETEKLNSFVEYKKDKLGLWYNFCDECCKKEFNTKVLVMMMSGTGDVNE